MEICMEITQIHLSLSVSFSVKKREINLHNP